MTADAEDALLSRCITTASAYGEALEAGDSRRANREHSKARAAFGAVRASPSSVRLLSELAEHNSPFVRQWAGVTLLDLSPEKAERVLEALEAEGGLAGINAEMVLMDWRNR